ncbi:MAG: hypothetical protein Q6351_007780 [Candidatus Njordarchaeum guaymaensis]
MGIESLKQKFNVGNYFIHVKEDTKIVVQYVNGDLSTLELKANTLIPLIYSEKHQNDIDSIIIPIQKSPVAVIKDFIRRRKRSLLAINTETFPTLEIGSLSTDKKIYLPGEVVRVIAIFPEQSHKEAYFTLYKEEKMIWRTTKNLSEFGTSLIELEELEVGEYTVSVKVEGMTESKKASFTVSEFKLSPLRAALERFAIERGRAKVRILLTKLEKKYSGSVTVGLFCGYCDEIVWSGEFKVKDGFLDVEVPIRGHTGPFELRINTSEGLTAAVSLKGTRVEERREYLIGDMNKRIFASLAPREGSKRIRGIYYRVEKGEGLLELEDVVGDIARIRILKDIEKMAIIVYNPKKRNSELLLFEKKKVNDTVEIPVSAPLIVVLAGLIITYEDKKVLREHFSIIFKEEELEDIKIICDDVVQKPELSIRIKPVSKRDGKVELFVIVLDDRIIRDDEEVNIGRGYLDFLRRTSKIGFRIRRGYDRALMLFAPRTLTPTSLPRAPRMDVLGPAGFGAVAPVAPKRVLETRAEEVLSVVEKSAEPAAGRAIAILMRKLPILSFKRLEVDANGETNISVFLGEELRTVRIEVIGVFGSSVRRIVKRVTMRRDFYLNILSPVHMDKGEECLIPIDYTASKDAELVVETFEGIQVFKIKAGSGRVYAKVKGPTEILAHIRIGEEILFDKKVTIKKVGEEEITVSEIYVLEPGQKIKAKRVLVYPSIDYLIKDIAMSLVKYPYGCAEQTSAKLKGLLLVFGSYGGHDNEEFLDKVKMLISAGSERMKLFFKGGLFSLWEDSKPDVNVTIKVLKNLRPVLNVDDPLVEELKSMVNKSIKELKERGVQDSELAEFDPAFISEIKTTEDAAHVLLALRNSREDAKVKKALKVLDENLIEEGTFIKWKAVKSWSGDVEATALALRALIAYEGLSDRVKKGLKYVFSKIVGGMLYSTADTSALLDMIAELRKTIPPKFAIKVKDKEEKLIEPTIVEEVEAKTYVIARIDKKVKVNELEAKAGILDVQVDLEKIKLHVGDTMKIRINVEGDTIIPISKIYLPPGLVAMIGGANVQTVTRVRSPITLDVIATRAAKGALKIITRDMYASWKIGLAKPIMIETVS